MTRGGGAEVNCEIATGNCASIGSRGCRNAGFEVFEIFGKSVVEIQGIWRMRGGPIPHRRRGEDVRRWRLEVEEDGIEE